MSQRKGDQKGTSTPILGYYFVKISTKWRVGSEVNNAVYNQALIRSVLY